MIKFISDTERKALKYGIKIILEKTDLVHAKGETDGCAGYFCSENKILAVATKAKMSDWLGVFVHESCHMDQWIENKFMWDKLSHGYNIFFGWLMDGSIVKREILEECVQDIIRLEKDCEIRSVKKIQKYNLKIDVDNYKRKANAYLYAYLYFLETKKWIPKIYASPYVWSLCSSRFPKEHLKIPLKLHRAFRHAGKIYE